MFHAVPHPCSFPAFQNAMIRSWIELLTPFSRFRWEGWSQRQHIILNTGWLLADRALRMIVGLLVGVWTARYLGPEQFGLYNYAVAFVFLFGTIAALGGLDGIVVRDIVRESFAKEEILGTAFALRLAAGLLTFLLAVGVGIMLHSGDAQRVMLVGLIAASQLFLAFDTIDFWFQSQVQSKYTVYAKNAAFLIMCAVRVGLILAQATLMAFAVAALCEVMLGAGMLVVFYLKVAKQNMNWRVSLVRAKAILALSWPLILAGGASAIYMKIDQVMVGNLLGDKAVGVYSAAVKVTEVWNIIPLAIMSSLYPSFIAIHQVSQDRYYERWVKVMRWMFWGAVALSATIAACSRPIVEVLYGEGYAQAAGIVAIHSYSGIGMSVSAVLNYQFALDGQTRMNLYGSALGAIVNVGLNVLFIRAYEVKGAAVASVLGFALVPFFQVLIYEKKTARAFCRAILGSWGWTRHVQGNS